MCTDCQSVGYLAEVYEHSNIILSNKNDYINKTNTWLRLKIIMVNDISN